MMVTTFPAPRWTSWVLAIAAVYNLLWGTAMILAPNEGFKLLGIEPPNYPTLVQCLGMVIGVYGIGYGIAARDPLRHWPIVVVGLLGKIFGPIGFVWAVNHGELPLAMGWTILTNDLIWWLPFTGILFHARRDADQRFRAAVALTLEELLDETTTTTGDTLLERSRKQPLAICLVRHNGCTFCRSQLELLSQQQAALQAQHLHLVIVQMGSPEEGKTLLSRYGIRNATVVSDAPRRWYAALDIPLGTLSQLCGIKPVQAAITSGAFLNHGVGLMVGDGMQLSGGAIVSNGQVVAIHRHQHSGENTDFVDLARVLNTNNTPPFEQPAAESFL